MKPKREEIEGNKDSGESVESSAEVDHLWTVVEAARFLNLSPGTVYHFLSQKKGLPCIRISRRCVRFSKRALADWVATLAEPSNPKSHVKKQI
jgi:excisionase family DNA binding protein